MKKHSKPLVIVTGPNKRLTFGWWATKLCLALAGLKGYYVHPGTRSLPSGAKGVIIGGGDDIEPKHYGLTGDAGAQYDPARDALEIKILNQALACDIPIFGICRGSQLINVVLGGSLYQDIRSQRKLTPNRNSVFPIKQARVSAGSLLESILECSSIGINSLHNQAIDRLADSLKVSARDADNFVQAIEHKDGSRHIIGVQWHPEYLPYLSRHRKLFNRFAKATKISTNILDGPMEEPEL
jgi:putative glutamine amidotransferase